MRWSSYLCVFYLFLFQLSGASNIKSDFRFLFSEADDCTEAMRRDQLRKNDSAFNYDAGIIHHICSQVYVLDAKNNALVGFKSSALLSSLRNRNLAITGDSLGLQFFVGLISSLSHEQHTFDAGDNDILNVDKAAFSHYPQYNSTIIWCHRTYVPSWDHSQWLALCGERFLKSDYIALVYGTWYKPMLLDPYNNPALTYTQNQDIALREYNKSLYSTREAILQVNPTAQLIYRTHPHAGNIDELNWYRCQRNQTLCTLKIKSDVPEYTDGWAWSQLSNSASWTVAQNKVLRSFVHNNDAILLDWHHLSMASLVYFNHLGVQTHYDSLHYCSEGLPRLASLLLQQALTLPHPRA